MNSCIKWFALLVAGVAASSSANAADGFASVNGDTTGGAGGPIVTVSTAADLFANAIALGRQIIQIQGTITSSIPIFVRSDKTIMGVGYRPTLLGEISIMGETNIIIHNLFIQNDAPVAEGDGIQLYGGAHHIWVDHCTFTDCDDGSLDITVAADYVTVSWCKFNYTRDNGHNFVNLIGGSDSDTGNYRLTFHHNWWGNLCHERMPSVRFGQVHIFNNYYNAPGNNYCVRTRIDAECLVENNFFQNVKNPWERFITIGSPGLLRATNNNVGYLDTSYGVTWNGGGLIPGTDTVFTPPYTYTLDSALDVPFVVTNGAGAHSAPWFTVDCGGGRSTNGSLTINGTIGQPDAGDITGVNFVLRGGYWALPVAVQTSGGPRLTIVPAGPGQATISWPPAPGYVLQETLSLAPANWSNSPGGATNPVVVPATVPTKFYRLFKP